MNPLNQFTRALLEGRPIQVLGDGQQSRGNTYVGDCVEGTLLALAQGVAGDVYNLGRGRSMRIADVVTELIALCRVRVHIEIDPALLRPSDVSRQERPSHSITSVACTTTETGMSIPMALAVLRLMVRSNRLGC